MTILVTGGAGFIGCNFISEWLSHSQETIVNLDALTYAGNLDNLKNVIANPQHIFVHGDINDKTLIDKLLSLYEPKSIINFAAESHVDRSISDPTHFVKTNIVGLFNLLDRTRHYWNRLSSSKKQSFCFLQASTDEVYGSNELDGLSFVETQRFNPSSPYSATKAAGDHLIHAYYYTYGLPTIIAHSSNNYGPYQFSEKLIPSLIQKALSNKPLTLYGDGLQSRNWLYIKDACRAIYYLLKKGKAGERYNVSSPDTYKNIDVALKICSVLDQLKPRLDGALYQNQISYVMDRLGHDRHYAIDSNKIRRETGWNTIETFDSGIQKTVQWYLERSFLL